ncbi:MAG: thioredoxin-dependent thiol peroxidase [Thermodesulfobacteriota bacterium]
MAMLKRGDNAPAFNLMDQDGKPVSLSDFKGKKILLYFYPKANTSGCTKQACSVRDAQSDLQDLGVVSLGISPDTPDAQRKFDQKHSLAFPLLSDPDHKVAELYGAWGEKKMYGKSFMGIVRSSFLIDEAGKIMGAWYKIKPESTVPEAKKVLESL